RGIRLTMDDGDPVIGFFTTRFVRARDENEAAAAVVERVLKEWKAGGAYAAGGVPDVDVRHVWRLGWWAALRSGAGGGYT
ncbi:hypothetical protein, partial [Enterococcus casseliflavus]|uniref:hypothetical protein n=1 Tax=Enterococcus casseliflavus TaxID=37734 RepID=UPI003D0C89ED